VSDSTAPSNYSPANDAASQPAALQRSAVLAREVVVEPHRFRVLTGDRPTDSLHLGTISARWPTESDCRISASR
jgi:hypothetical protein